MRFAGSDPQDCDDDLDWRTRSGGAEVVPSDVFAAALVLKRAIPRSVLRSMSRGMPTALVLVVRSDDWVDPLRRAAQAILGRGVSAASSGFPVHEYGAGLVYFARTFADRSGKPDASGAGLARHLSRGGSAVAVVPDPELLPAPFHQLADRTIEIGPPTGRDLAKVVRQTTGFDIVRGVDDLLAASVSSIQIAAAVRAGTTPAACVARLRAMVERACNAAADVPALEDLGGYADAKSWGLNLKADLARRRENPSEVSVQDITRGLLLTGSPGTGKTLYADALAKSCGIPIVKASYREWQSGDAHMGIVLQRMSASFLAARQAARLAGAAILFIDEIDAIPGRAWSSRDQHASWFASLTDALLCLTEKSARPGVTIVAASNHVDRIDEAILRSGRIETQVRLVPGQELAHAFRVHLGAALPDADLDWLAAAVPSGTGADAARWVGEARAVAGREGRPLVFDDLVGRVLPPETRPAAMVARVSRHEAAHAVAVLALGRQRLESVTLCTREAEGAVHVSEIAGAAPTRRHYEDLVVAALAGRAADAHFGDPDAGSASDLRKATAVVLAVRRELGLAGSLLSLGGADHARALLLADPGLRSEVDRDLRRLFGVARRLVARHLASVEAVAAELRARRFLTGDQVRLLLGSSQSAGRRRR